MVMRTSLKPREYSFIDFLLNIVHDFIPVFGNFPYACKGIGYTKDYSIAPKQNMNNRG